MLICLHIEYNKYKKTRNRTYLVKMGRNQPDYVRYLLFRVTRMIFIIQAREKVL